MMMMAPLSTGEDFPGVDSRLGLSICGVCGDSLSAHRSPMLLPCLHSVCASCIPSSNERGVAVCPLCAMLFSPGDVTTNPLFFDASPTSPTQKCGGCECDQIEGCCVECGEALCVECVAAHRRVRLTRDHTIHTQMTSSGFAFKRYCSLHKDELYKLFCLTCGQLTCRDCQLMLHRNHSFQFVGEVVSERRQTLEALSNRVKEQRAYTQRSLYDVEGRLLDIEDVQESFKLEVKHALKEIRDVLVLAAMKLITEAKMLCMSEVERIKHHQVLLNKLLDRQGYLLEFTHRAMDTVDQSLLLSCANQVQQQLESVLGQAPPPLSRMLAISLQVNGPAIQHSLNNFGKLSWCLVPFACSRRHRVPKKPKDTPQQPSAQAGSQDTSASGDQSVPKEAVPPPSAVDTSRGGAVANPPSSPLKVKAESTTITATTESPDHSSTGKAGSSTAEAGSSTGPDLGSSMDCEPSSTVPDLESRTGGSGRGDSGRTAAAGWPDSPVDLDPEPGPSAVSTSNDGASSPVIIDLCWDELDEEEGAEMGMGDPGGGRIGSGDPGGAGDDHGGKVRAAGGKMETDNRGAGDSSSGSSSANCPATCPDKDTSKDSMPELQPASRNRSPSPVGPHNTSVIPVELLAAILAINETSSPTREPLTASSPTEVLTASIARKDASSPPKKTLVASSPVSEANSLPKDLIIASNLSSEASSPPKDLQIASNPVSEANSSPNDLIIASSPVRDASSPPKDLPIASSPVSEANSSPKDLIIASSPVREASSPPKDLQIASSPASEANSSPKDLIIASSPASEENSSPKDLIIASSPVRDASSSSKDLQIASSPASEANSLPKDLIIASSPVREASSSPKDLQIASSPVSEASSLPKDLQIANSDANETSPSPKDLQIANSDDNETSSFPEDLQIACSPASEADSSLEDLHIACSPASEDSASPLDLQIASSPESDTDYSPKPLVIASSPVHENNCSPMEVLTPSSPVNDTNSSPVQVLAGRHDGTKADPVTNVAKATAEPPDTVPDRGTGSESSPDDLCQAMEVECGEGGRVQEKESNSLAGGGEESEHPDIRNAKEAGSEHPGIRNAKEAGSEHPGIRNATEAEDPETEQRALVVRMEHVQKASHDHLPTEHAQMEKPEPKSNRHMQDGVSDHVSTEHVQEVTGGAACLNEVEEEDQTPGSGATEHVQEVPCDSALNEHLQGVANDDVTCDHVRKAVAEDVITEHVQKAPPDSSLQQDEEPSAVAPCYPQQFPPLPLYLRALNLNFSSPAPSAPEDPGSAGSDPISSYCRPLEDDESTEEEDSEETETQDEEICQLLPKKHWLPQVYVLRLSLSSTSIGQPPAQFRLREGDGPMEFFIQEVTEEEESAGSLSGPGGKKGAVREQRCRVCGVEGLLHHCSSCRTGYHRGCHIPPLMSKPRPDWVCGLCIELSSDVGPQSSVDGDTGSCMNSQDQKKCEHVLLSLSCSKHRPALFTQQPGTSPSTLMSLTCIRGRLLQTVSPPYRTPSEFVSDIWLLLDQLLKRAKWKAESERQLRALQVIFGQRLQRVFGAMLHPSLLRNPFRRRRATAPHRRTAWGAGRGAAAAAGAGAGGVVRSAAVGGPGGGGGRWTTGGGGGVRTGRRTAAGRGGGEGGGLSADGSSAEGEVMTMRGGRAVKRRSAAERDGEQRGGGGARRRRKRRRLEARSEEPEGGGGGDSQEGGETEEGGEADSPSTSTADRTNTTSGSDPERTNGSDQAQTSGSKRAMSKGSDRSKTGGSDKTSGSDKISGSEISGSPLGVSRLLVTVTDVDHQTHTEEKRTDAHT